MLEVLYLSPAVPHQPSLERYNYPLDGLRPSSYGPRLFQSVTKNWGLSLSYLRRPSHYRHTWIDRMTERCSGIIVCWFEPYVGLRVVLSAILGVKYYVSVVIVVIQRRAVEMRSIRSG